MADLIMKFRDIGDDLLPLVGGKALNLGIMARAGLPVPDGVCVTTEAYARVADGAGMDPILDALAVVGQDELPGLASRARDAILAAPISSDIAQAVQDTAQAGRPVAVRSSATAEDLPQASFAGQQDTFLNVVGPEAVLDAVRRCWASLWTERAVSYRAANGIDHRQVRLAVVIQQMIDAEVAGVLFTANPLTGRRGETVIDASPGLGEAVVSGAVNPDQFVVSPDGRITERRIGDKNLMIRSVEGGGTESVKPADPGAAALSDDRIRELAALGARVAELYGSPQDIEWAIDKPSGGLWLTQARPITTLYPLPPRTPDLRAYFSFNVAQGVFRPFTPMGVSAIQTLASGAVRRFGFKVSNPDAGPSGLVEAGQRLFLDVTPALRSRPGRRILPRMLDVGEARSAAIVRELIKRPEFSVNRSALPFVRRVGGFVLRNRIPLVLAQAIISPRAAQRRIARLRRKIEAVSINSLDQVEPVVIGAFARVAPTVMPVALAGLATFGLGVRLLRGRVEPGELTTVLSGIPNNVTTEMDLKLWHLAGQGQPAIDEFLRAYGHRAVAEIDMGMPRWSEDPSHVLGVLDNYRRLDDPDLAPDVIFERGRRAALAKVEELGRRAGGLRGRVVRFALGRARQLVGHREMPKFLMVKIMATVREQILRTGAEMAAAGNLEKADDVFFLTFAEVRAGGGDRRELVRVRRAEYERELARRHIPRMMLSDGTELQEPADPEGGLRGTPASAGTVTGTARVVLDPVGAHLEPGEILVAPSTDPGWTPLFLTAGGLVMEMGGAVSHGAVVAREYGIPAVVGVSGATERIQTGQKITVNGSLGTVTVD